MVQPWSTLPGMLKIDFQELFYFMILPVGGTLIDLALSITRMAMELRYLTTAMNALPRTMKEHTVQR